MASYPVKGICLMENYDLAQKYSWDTESLLKMVKLQMCMKYQQVNSKILHVVRQNEANTVKSAGPERRASTGQIRKLSADSVRKFSANTERKHAVTRRDWKLSAAGERKLDESLQEFVKQDQNFSRQNIEFRIKSQDKKDKSGKGDRKGSGSDRSTSGESLKDSVSEREGGYLEVIEEEPEEVEEVEEVLDELLDGEVDWVTQYLPKIEPDGNTKKVQFSHTGRRPVSYNCENMRTSNATEILCK